MSEEQQQGQGNEEQQGGEQNGAGGNDQGGEDSLDGLKRALEKERADRKRFERQARDLGTWKQQRESADMTETERTTARLKDYEAKEQQWESEKRDHRLQTAAISLATKAGAVYPEQLHRLIDRSAVEWTDDGQPRNLTALVNELKREYPALFRSHGGAGNADAGAGNGGSQSDASMNALIRRAAGRE